jgi:hypothetical protein
MALSMSVSAGKHNPRHNTDLDYRARLKNVDKSLSHLNETLLDEGVENAYSRLFGAAAEAYNAKQRDKHPERVIEDYHAKVDAAWRADMAKVESGKKAKSNVPAPQIEYVIQIGNRDTWRDSVTVEEYRAIYAETLDAVRARTRGAIDWYQAAIHFDEPDGTPHLHVVGITYGTGNKRGLETQVSMKQALKTLGLDRLPDLQNLLMGELEKVCHAHGIERDVMDCKRRHQDVPEWQQTCRDLADMTDKLELKTEQVARAEERLECLQQREVELAGEVEVLREKALEPVGEDFATSARTLWEGRGDGGKERGLAAEGSQLESRIGELEQQVQEARSRAGQLERDIERLGVGVRDAGARRDGARERVGRLIERLGWVPDHLSELAQGIGKRLGARVMSAFDAFVAGARESYKAYNAARAARGEVPHGRGWSQER